MSYVMKWRYVVGVFLLLCICVFPASAADGFGVEKLESEYLILPLNMGDFIEQRSSIYSSVTHGDSRSLYYLVSSGTTELDVTLSWNLPPKYNSLSLKIFDPNGSIVSEFTDLYESSIPNGIIPIKIRGMPDLTVGEWRFSVIGSDVSGTQTFNIIINSN